MSLLFRYLKRYRLAFIFGLILLLIVDGAQLLVPQIMKAAIDKLYQGNASFNLLFICAGLIILANVVVYVGRYWWRHFIFGSAFRISRDLRDDFLRHLMKMDLSFYTRFKTGDLMAYATNDIQQITRFCAMGVVALFDSTVLMVASIMFMCAINVKLTMYILIPLPIISILVKIVGVRLERNHRKAQEVFGQLMDRAREYFNSIKVIQAYNFQERASAKFNETSDDYMKCQIRILKIFSFFRPSFMLIIFFASCMVVFLGGRDVIFGRISIGDFVAFSSYLNIIIWPMFALGMIINIYNRARASLNRLAQVFDIESDYPIPVINSIEGELNGLSVRDLGFSYKSEGNEFKVLEGVSFDISHGEKIGIIGTTASGKSTLFSLLFRLLIADKGEIRYKGMEIKELCDHIVSRNVHYLPQTPYLFSDSIRNNLLFANSEADDAMIKQALQKAKILDDVLSLEKGLSQIIGEKGVTLSGGQKQRLAVSRLFLTDKPFVFIDDSLSACDADTESLILDNLFKSFETSTFLIATSRVKVMEHMDRVLVFDKGRLIEQGTHEQLKQGSVLYRELFELQKLKEELEDYAD